MKNPTSHHDKPMAAAGLDSYRYPTGHGWVMIGATDPADALREAARSLSHPATAVPERLEHWDGQQYVPAPEALFTGIFPAGIVYADRRREEHGDYARVAFLDYRTLTFEASASADPRLLARAREQAAGVQARQGQEFQVSACNQTVLLGEGLPAVQEAVRAAARTEREARERATLAAATADAGETEGAEETEEPEAVSVSM